MKRGLVAGWAGIVLVAQVAGAAAIEKPADLQERTVATGLKTRVSAHYLLQADCSSGGDTVVRILTPPKQGKVEIEEHPVVMSYPKDNAASACNGKSIPGKVVLYQSNDGYTGKDEVQLEIFFQNGLSRKLKLQILVK
jgi:hypothetical protein